MSQTPLLDSIRRTIEERNLFSARTRIKYVSAMRKASADRSPCVVTRLKRLRGKVIDEIVTSEESYLMNLSLLEKFKKLFNYHLDNPKKLQGLLRELEPIRNVNENLYKELKNGPIGKAFLNYAPFLKLYSSYASGFQEQELFIDQMLESNEKLNEAVLALESNENKSFKSLLITPIQRVPRYKLLLAQLLSFMKGSDEDYDQVLESLNKVEAVARHMNEMVRNLENNKRMIEIGKMMNFAIVMPGRTIIREGFIKKVSSNSERYLILCTDQIMICKVKSDFGTKGSLDCNLILPIKKVSISRKMNTIEIICESERFKFHETEGWYESLNEAIKSLRTKAATLKKPSSRRLPMKKREIQEIREETPKLKRFLNISGKLDEIVEYLSPKRKRISLNDDEEILNVRESSVPKKVSKSRLQLQPVPFINRVPGSSCAIL